MICFAPILFAKVCRMFQRSGFWLTSPGKNQTTSRMSKEKKAFLFRLFLLPSNAPSTGPLRNNPRNVSTPSGLPPSSNYGQTAEEGQQYAVSSIAGPTVYAFRATGFHFHTSGNFPGLSWPLPWRWLERLRYVDVSLISGHFLNTSYLSTRLCCLLNVVHTFEEVSPLRNRCPLTI